jgi:hypothetical protein
MTLSFSDLRCHPVPGQASFYTTMSSSFSHFTSSPIFPSEIILMIGTILESTGQKATLSSLSRCSQNTYETLTPLLYKSVTIPQRDSLNGLMYNFGHLIPDYSMMNIWVQPTNQDFIGHQRGLKLLNMIRELAFESIPKVIKIIQTPATSNWHELKILTNHYQVLESQKRLKRMTITGTALQQLQVSSPMGEMGKIEMPSDGLPPPPDSDDFSFFPQSGFPLKTLIAYYQPLHLIIHHPLTCFNDLIRTGHRPWMELPLSVTRPHEHVLINMFKGLKGQGTTVCAHEIHDQYPHIGHIGAHHYISYVAFPTVPRQLEGQYDPSKDIRPYVSLYLRILGIKDMIRRSNPQIPDSSSCISSSRPLTLDDWKQSKESRWTIYRAGAMINGIVRRDEWISGSAVESKVRAWLAVAFGESKGHPKGFAADMDARLTFVHGGEDADPDDLVCEGCGHLCRVPSE